MDWNHIQSHSSQAVKYYCSCFFWYILSEFIHGSYPYIYIYVYSEFIHGIHPCQLHTHTHIYIYICILIYVYYKYKHEWLIFALHLFPTRLPFPIPSPPSIPRCACCWGGRPSPGRPRSSPGRPCSSSPRVSQKKCHGDGEMVSLYQFIPVYTSRNQMIFDFITMVYWVLKTTGVVASAHVHNPVLGLDPCEDVKRFMQDNGWLQVFPSWRCWSYCLSFHVIPIYNQ